MNLNGPFQPNNVPLIGQEPQMLALHASCAITPHLMKRLEAWSKRVGIPVPEIGQTIFRLGLIALSLEIERPPIDADEAIQCIPLTANEDKAPIE